MASRSQAATRPTVVVGVDGSEDSRRALHWAAGQARRRHQRLRILHAVDLPHPERAIRRPETTEVAAARRIVESAVADVERTWPEVTASGEWPVGPPSAELVRSASPTDLVVVGSRGRDCIESAAIGSVSNEVARRAACPVIIVRWPGGTRHFHTHRGVVVGTDGSAGSMEAVDFAFAAAAERKLPLTAVHALRDQLAPPDRATRPDRQQLATADGDRVDVAESVADWTEHYPEVAVDVRYENGRPAQVLADLSAGSDLLVIGSHGRNAHHRSPLGHGQPRCPRTR